MKAMVEGLEAVRGRKSVLLFSAGLIEDQEQIDARHVLEAARRANVAVYFIDVRGIVTGSAAAWIRGRRPPEARADCERLIAMLLHRTMIVTGMPRRGPVVWRPDRRP